jgi:predicted amidohydrolase
MMEPLRISLVQTHLDWQDAAKNLSRFTNLIAPLKGKTDLTILPEMFTSGFTMEAAEVAEPMDGPSVQWMQGRARELDAVITGSLVIEENGHYFNRLLWVEPDGRTLHYDKRHLFALAGEAEHYTAGTERLIIDYRGWRICPLICYDLRFPVWSRNDADIDLLIYLANWPATRAADWNTLLAARAIENQCYVAAVNRTGQDANGYPYQGDSCLIDPGPNRLLAQLGEKERVMTITIAKNELLSLRKKLPFLADRDGFSMTSV